MTLEQLRIFIAVAEREHLTRAAEALPLSPSAVSAAIAALEGRYGVKLFDRIGRRLALTEAGRLFLIEARRVLAQAREAETVLYEVAGAQRGLLSVSTSQTVGNYWIASRLARFRREFPGVEVRLHIGNTEQAAALVLSGEADMGLVEGRVDDPRLSVTPLDGDRVVMVTPPGMDETPQRFVAREKGSGTRDILDDVLRAQGLNAEAIVLTLPSNEAVRAAVEAGSGAAVLSWLVVEGAVAAGRLMARDIDVPVRPFHLIRLKERSEGRAAAAFKTICAG